MTDQSDFERAYKREKVARKEAENILEARTREVFQANAELKAANEALLKQQRQLLKTEKLAALGTLSAGMAHEINNPLAFIISNMNALGRYCDKYIEVVQKAVVSERDHNKDELESMLGNKGLEYLVNDTRLIFSEVQSGLERVQDIVANLKRFSRTKATDRKNSDVNEAIRFALKILKNEVKYKCTIDVSLGELSPIYCNVNELSQVFINIIMNAVQAIPSQGHIWISSAEHEDSIKVVIKDNGMGIPEDIVDQIFNPFFTAKPIGEGTGLGLSVSYGIVEELGGDIKVESEKNKGATFIITLPKEQRLTLADRIS